MPENRVARAGLELIAERDSEPEPGRQRKKPPVEVGKALGQDLAVVVELLPRFVGDRLGDRQRLEHAEKGDGQRARGQLPATRPS